MNEIVTGWIDGVPSTWDCYKIGACFSLGSGTTPPTSEPHWYDGNVPWIQTSELREKLIREHSRSVSEAATKQFSALRVYKLGAIAVAMYGATIGRVGMLGIDATTNQACCVLSERLWLTKEFVFWWFQGIRDRLIERGNGGGQPNISQSVISGLRLYAPRKTEQQHIAAWLDLQTNRIDNRRELLGKKRELLRDLKKAITEEATFLGLAGGVVLRDSEIDWLGKVPAHWTTLRLGSLFREAADAGIEGLPMLSVSLHTGITDKELDDDEMERKVSRSEDRTLYKRVKPGDLVYNQMRAWQGAFGAAQIEGLVSPAYVVARPRRGVVPRFVEYLLRAPAAMEEIRRRSRGITDFRLRLYWDEFKNIRIALPPMDEQEAIAAFLDRKLSQIDRQIALIDRLDDLLQQQRKAIIHEAVTGKIDLRSFDHEEPARHF